MPTIRGTGIQASSASSYTVTWPTGTVAGDTAVLFAENGFGINTPSGWTVLDSHTGLSFVSGMTFSKILSGADITAGSVTVTTTGTFDGVVAILTLVGSSSVIKSTDAAQNSSGSSSISLTSTGSAVSSDLAIYFGSNRAASTDTVSSGTLQRQANDGSAASGCLYTETGVTGALNRTFSYSSAGSGNYQAIVLLGLPPVITAPNLIAPLANAGSGARHQPVKVPAATAFTPSTFVPVPVAANLKGATTGSAYTETISAQGGTSPYTFAVSTGALPTGTSLNSSTGAITGTPSATGTFNFTVLLTDTNGYTGSQAFTIAVAAPASANSGYTA